MSPSNGPLSPAPLTTAATSTAASPVPPADIVVFGGTGDLAVRKLLPALYLRDRDGQLTPDTRIVATSRAGLDEAGYRDKMRGELPRFVRPEELDPVVVERFVARLTHVSLDIDDLDGWGACRRRAARPRQGAGLLPRHRAVAVRHRQRPPGHPRPRHRAVPPGAGEAARPRPRLRPGDQRRRRRGVRGAADLPDRPLPGQGERPEPAGHPVREHLPRAAVERQLDRPRADHGVGDARGRHPRRLLRRLRRAARHDPEPPAPAALPGRHGATRRTSAARPCATRSSRCCRR